MYWGLLKYVDETGFRHQPHRRQYEGLHISGAPMPVEVMSEFEAAV
jgi:hypothetical protein